jgi:hypothetical protein
MRPALPLALLLSLAAPSARAASPVVLLPATGANVPEPELAAVTDVLRADLEETGAFTVALGETPGGAAPEPTPAQAGAEAARARAGLAVTVRVSRLGSAAVVRLAAYRPDGGLAHADQLPAASADDLEPALKRLARGLAEARPAAGNADLDTVTEREASPQRRQVATRGFGVRLGGTWLVDRPGTGEPGALTTVGLVWLYDGRAFLADVSLEGGAGRGDALFAVGLGVYLPLTRGNVAPYVGAGAAWEALSAHGGGNAGLAVRGAAGVLANRLSTLQLRVEAGWQVAAFTVSAHGEQARPQGPFLSGAIVF